MTQAATYDPHVFDCMSVVDAQRIILTPELGRTTEDRWERETPYLLDLIQKESPALNERSVVLDYGCGIGRIARGLIARHGCMVIGVDISPHMRGLAASYVESPLFFALHPDMLPALGERWADLTISVWVLQHCVYPHRDMDAIWRATKKGGDLFVVNERERRVPTKEYGWCDDKVHILNMLDETFLPKNLGYLDPGVVTPEVSQRTFWATYHNQ